MDRKSTSYFSAPFVSIVKRILVVGVLVLLLALPLCVNQLVLWRVAQSLKISFHRNTRSFFPGRLDFPNASLSWRDRLNVLSGHLTVIYSIPFIWSGKGSFHLKGENLRVSFGHDLESFTGSKEVTINHATATLLLTRPGEFHLENLSIDSDTLGFKMGTKKI